MWVPVAIACSVVKRRIRKYVMYSENVPGAFARVARRGVGKVICWSLEVGVLECLLGTRQA
jgi:hypothetical protein